LIPAFSNICLSRLHTKQIFFSSLSRFKFFDTELLTLIS
jgi:hypothetical protein